MKQRKLKGYVLPTIYVIVLMLVFGTVSFITTLVNDNPSYLYSVGILTGSSRPVMGEDNVDSSKVTIIKPFSNEKVTVDKYFYDVKDSEDKQAKSLIYFENTYMKNTGVLYQSDITFDCIAVLDGKVLNIKNDDILGTVVEIEHNTNLRTIYYTLGGSELKVGDAVNQGDLIGVSGTSRISNAKNTLLFEVYYNGTLLNPEEFYTMDPSTLK